MDRNIGVILSANATSFKTQMQMASGAVKDFENQTGKSGANVSKIATGIKVAFAAMAVALAAGFVMAVNQASQFEAAMRNVNTISKLSEDSLGALSDQVVAMSTRLPQSAKTLAEGLYDIASSGFQGAEGMKVLEVSATAASAGLTETAVASKAVVAVLNAYGLSADSAAHVSDVLFQTVNVGVITFEELASQLGDVVGMASAAGVSIEEVGAATAAMTLSGISAAEATTSLNRVLQSIIDPSDELNNLLHSMGYESGKAALDADGLHGVMEKLRTVTGGNVEALLKLFPEIRSARGAFALMAADGQNYAKAFDSITDSTQTAGATQAAFNEQMKGIGAQFEVFKNKINAGLILLGTKAIPALSDGLKGLEGGIGTLIDLGQQIGSELLPAGRDLISTFKSLASAARNIASDVAPVAKIFAAVAAGVIITGIKALATALSVVAGAADKLHVVIVALGTYMLTKWALALGTSAVAALKTAIDALAIGAYNAAGNFSAMGAALISPAALLTGVALVAGGAVTAFNNADAAADKLAKSFEKNLDPGRIDTYRDAIAGAAIELERQKKVADEYDSTTGVLKAFGEVLNPFVANRGLDAAKSVEALSGELEVLHRMAGNVQWSMTNVAIQIGKLSGKDLLKGFEIEPNARQSIIGYRESLAALIDETAKAQNIDISNLSDTDPKDVETMKELAAAVNSALLAAQNGSVQTDALTTSYGALADQTSSATEKLKAWKDTLDAVFGITLNEFDANTKYVESLFSLQGAVKTNGDTLDAYTEAGRKNRDMLSQVTSNALDHAVAVAEQTNSLSAGKDVLLAHVAEIQEYLVAMGLTPEAAQAFTNAAGLTVENLQKVATDAGTATTALDAVTAGIEGIPGGKEVQIDANTKPAMDALSNVEQRISHERQIPVTATVDTLEAENAIRLLIRNREVVVKVNASQTLNRWGGVYSYASGGVASGAQIASGIQHTWAEPSTGGEAYIPKRGNTERSLRILRTAAGWLDQMVVPRPIRAIAYQPAPPAVQQQEAARIQRVNETVVIKIDNRVLAEERRRYDRMLHK